MTHRSFTRRGLARPVALAALSMATACGPAPEPADTGPDIDDPAPSECVDDTDFFRDQLWAEVLNVSCISCHTAEGLARETDLVLVTSAQPDYLAVNRAILGDLAGLERDGTSIILLKPLGEDDHGGGKILDAEDPGYALLQEFVARVDAPIECLGDEPVELDDGLSLLSPVDTLRKSMLMVTGRLPSVHEVEAVQATGEPALRAVLREAMQTEAFHERMKELFNDVLLTDKYLPSRDALSNLDSDAYPDRYWFDYIDSAVYNRNTMRDRANDAVAREPLELLAHILRNDLPYTEMLTADYTMVNDYSANTYGLIYETPDPDDPRHFDFYPAQLPGVSHAGVLTTIAYLHRFPSTDTNRNRHRSRMFFANFLATDILALADRPIDPTTSSAVHNPTLNDPQCNVCHAVMDPVAGLFQNWGNTGHWEPPELGWYPEMAVPGFGDAQLASYDQGSSLRWLAEQSVEDRRFALAPVQHLFHGLTGLDVLTALGSQNDDDQWDAYNAQVDELDRITDAFVTSGYDLEVVVEELALSRYFRAVDTSGSTAATLSQAGTAHLLTPEELNRKIEAVTGYPWRERYNHRDLLLDDYQMMYGGIDSNSVTERLDAPNGIMGAVGLRMATEQACWAVPRDFLLDAKDRRLFPYVEISFLPITADGFDVPEVQARIRQNIQWLHHRLLGEHLPLDHEEIEASYQLWMATWAEGMAKVQTEEIDDYMPGACQARKQFFTDEYLPDSRQIRRDDDYTIRAWMAVATYLLSDFRFLYE